MTLRKIVLQVVCIGIFVLGGSLVWAGSSLAPFDPATAPAVPDYTRKESWLALPDDPGRYPVDVFWVYPTVFMEPRAWLMDIADAKLKSAAMTTVTEQASVFNGQANVYAPLYRQMNIAAMSLPDEQADDLMQYGAGDVWQAFTYYLAHYNQGRPFILAGHSQGSKLITAMAVDKWGRLGVEDRVVAAYLLGWSITPEDLTENPELDICTASDQTGCFILYNTMADGRQDQAPTRIPGTVVVNPLTWKTDDTFAPAAMNLGAVFFKADGTTETYPEFTSAQIKDGGLVVDPADPALVTPEHAVFPKGVYHAYDYALFYENLKANAAERIKAFAAKGKN